MNKSRSLLRFVSAFTLTFILLAVSVSTSKAQYFSFGKNRVQYKQFDWRFIQSEHFDVYYYQSKNYDLAFFSAISLEAALKQVQEDFQHQIADRIQVIIYDSHNDFSQTNVVQLPVGAEGIGGVTDLFKNRITMPFNGNYDDFRAVLQHELIHAVINDMFYGGSVQSLISGGAQLQIPTWLNEGLAEYQSIGWDTNTDMYMRDAVINDYLPPVNRLGGYFAYRGGQSVWNYIVEEYGREKIGELMQTMKTQRSVEAAFKRSFGLTIEEFSDRWEDYYRKRYFPEVAEREQVGDFGELLTGRQKSGTFNTSPALSPQGDKIAMITNERGFFDVVVISAITGNKLKTLIKGGDNVNFEELNILNPNLSWSPDGSRLTLSSKSKGSDDLAIVEYNTGKVTKIKFPSLDAIGSVAWSPDGDKIAFDASIGPFQDIFVYNLETQEFTNLTNDAISDYEPSWSSDSQTVYFTSARGDNVQLGTMKKNIEMLASDYLYNTDIYSVRLGSNRAVRLTKTPNWNEKQSSTTVDGKLIFISDKNGIPNVYQLDLDDRTTSPLTNLQTGVMQMSISSDGSRLAVNSINEGYLDIYLIRNPFLRKNDGELTNNEWAQRRLRESHEQRVPAIGYAQQMMNTPGLTKISVPQTADAVTGDIAQNRQQQPDSLTAKTDTTQSDTTTTEEQGIDFRNYVFEDEVENDTAFAKKYLDESKFEPKNNTTDDGRYLPKDYRLKFTTDFIYGGGSFSTYYGAYGLTQLRFSDLLGNHQVSFGSNLVFDLRNSDYYLEYANLKNRTNFIFNFFHSAQQFQDFSGRLFRFRTFGGGVTAQYPIDQFRRLEFGISGISLSQNFTQVGVDISNERESTFMYPQLTFTSDHTLPGFLTPRAGNRYAVSLSASPPITNETLQFISGLGDFRKYINLGSGYSFAMRGSGAASFGRDSQTYFMGGMLGWINSRFSNNTIPVETLGQSFLTTPALPLRGYEINAISGDRFSLTNLEFRFPLFAAILPGPIPVIPLYNITGVAFLDAGMAWGKRVEYDLNFTDGSRIPYAVNSPELDFRVREPVTKFIELNANGQPVITGDGNLVVVDEGERQPGTNYLPRPFQDGDVLIGAGFGFRTILFGLPLRYDVGWPYFRDGFAGDAIHYISIGIDF